MTTRAQMSESAEHEGGHTNLMRAALEGQTETVKTLLESGADVNEKDDEGRTSLMFAVTNMQTDSAKALLEHAAGHRHGRSFWQKHRDKLTTAGGAGAGAIIGGIAGGKKGAAIGAVIGGGGAAVYTYGIRKRRPKARY